MDMDKGKYSIKGIKSFQGMEGYGFNATLLRDGKPVAFCIDEGCGGEVRIEWKDGYHGTPEEARLTAHLATIPPVLSDLGGEGADKITLTVDAGWFVTDLVSDEEERRRLERLAKKSILFRLPTDKKGAWSYLKGTPRTPASEAYVLRKHPEAVFYGA